MHESILGVAGRLSDEALQERLKEIASREHGATVELVAHLAILLGRKKHLGQGWGSVYKWCCGVLHLSPDAAYNRVAAARAVRRFPVVLDHIAAGFLNVTMVKVLRPVLTSENHEAVLAEAKHRSRKECELIVARLQPKVDVPSTIRKLPAPHAPAPALLLTTHDGDTPPPLPATTPPGHRPVIAPLTPERYRIQFTASKETHDKLRHLQDLLCREVPDGDPAAIFDRAADALIREVEGKKRAAAARPQSPRPAKTDSRHIPAHVERSVWTRDGNQCAFVGTDGRCTETRYLELHHVQPYRHQGPATVDNISVRCRAHNVYESELVFGAWAPMIAGESRAKYVVWRETAPSQDGNHLAGFGAMADARPESPIVVG